MKRGVALASCSVVLIAVTVATAAALGPDEVRVWLLLCGAVAVIAAMQSVALEPKDLTPALLFSLPPVIALVADGSPSWLIGPLAALLLAAGELNALSWECQGTGPAVGVRRRLLNTGRLTALGVAASLPVGLLAPGRAPGGTIAVAAAALGIAAFGGLVFRGSA